MPPWPRDPCHGVIGMTRLELIGVSIAARLAAVKLPLESMVCAQSMRLLAAIVAKWMKPGIST
jgi:hypothetical protein